MRMMLMGSPNYYSWFLKSSILEFSLLYLHQTKLKKRNIIIQILNIKSISTHLSLTNFNKAFREI